jgi:hypothetical protein
MKFLISAIGVLAVGAGVMFWIIKDSAADHTRQQVSFDAEETEFAGDDTKPAPFDGKRAMKYLRSICSLGPRISGTASMRRQQEMIKKHFEDLGAKVTLQTFTAKQNSVRGEVEMTNIIVSFQPEKKRRVILCSHYDTRPIADQEPDPRDWKKPFVSANDGGSGVALLMELGHHMKDLKTNVGVDFVIFDGEEYIFQTSGALTDRYFIGSQHFARTWVRTKDRPDYSAAILLDMVGGQDIRFPYESHSYSRYPDLCKQVWGIAREQQVRAFVPRQGSSVLDDHTELQKVGIPAIDIIDFEYPHWHRLSDTPDNCSADSLEQVSRVLSVWLQRTK